MNSTPTYTHSQMSHFCILLHRARSANIAIPIISINKSSALLTTTLMHFEPDEILSHDTRGFVRCGGAIYGQGPVLEELRSVSTLCVMVKHVAIIQCGERVGYDCVYVAPHDLRIATLTIGFVDGYPHDLGNGVGRVLIRRATFLVMGNVCMDMMMVDLGLVGEGDVHHHDDERHGVVDSVGCHVLLGDVAVLWGPEGMDSGEECGNGLVP